MKTLTTLFLLFFIINTVHADTKDKPEENLKEYDIEIIIFEDAHARYINSEMWQQNSADDSTSLITTNANTKAAKNQKKSALSQTDTGLYKNITPVILKKEYKRINHSSEYKVLFYGAWQQAGLEKSKAFEININELNNNHKKRSQHSIAGQLKVVLARYLHFYSQLEYQRQGEQHETNAISSDGASDISAKNHAESVNKSDTLAVGNNIYPMKNHRRMRSKELHYIDHPLIGILIQINPVVKPEEELSPQSL